MRAYRSRWARGAAALALIVGLAGGRTLGAPASSPAAAAGGQVNAPAARPATAADSAQEAAGPDADDYQAAAALVEGNLLALLRNADVTPHWLAADLGTPGFWYGRDGDSGPELAIFDLETQSRRPAFDHARMAAAIFEALTAADAPTGERDKASLEGLLGLSLSSDLATLTARHGAHRVTCSVADFGCAAAAITPPEPGLLPSPDGARAAFTRDDNLFWRDLKNGLEAGLTHDGKPYFSYGKWPDSSLLTVVARKTGLRQPPYLSSWSPDSRYLLAPRIDERLLEAVPFVEWVPTDGSRRPVVHLLREPVAGDEDEMGVGWFLFDTEEGGRVQVELDGASLPEGIDTPGLGGGVIGWDLERNRLYMLGSAYAGKSAALVAVDVESGKATPVVWETNETRVEANTHIYNRPNVRLVRGPNDERRVLWYSDRTGWGHLYLYELAGDDTADLVGTVTAGDWTVLDIIHVDEGGQQVYFTGGGREPGDPYLRHLYRASFDSGSLGGGEVTLLTANEADHHFEPAPVPMMQVLFGLAPPPPRIRPDLGVFLDTYSTVDRPPVTVLRSTKDGKVLAEIEQADASRLFEAGFVPPERRAFVAADGETEVYSVYFAPQREVDGHRHPVIDAVYGGPQVFVAPRNFVQAVGARNPAAEPALARLGFAVVVTDGRGTPGRSSAFRDAGYPEFTQVGVDDHVAVIRQWAELKPEMDPERVGIYGWSWGGTFTAQAILSRPDFYDVAVSGAGVYDYAAIYPGFEAFTGPAVYSDGGRTRTRPDEAPKSWEPLDITAMAGNLEGRLLIVYGDMDENVPPAQAFRLVDALIQANKPYDLLYLPNRNHGGGAEPYALLRTWDYFVEHLLGVQPPRDVTFEVKPAAMVF